MNSLATIAPVGPSSPVVWYCSAQGPVLNKTTDAFSPEVAYISPITSSQQEELTSNFLARAICTSESCCAALERLILASFNKGHIFCYKTWENEKSESVHFTFLTKSQLSCCILVPHRTSAVVWFHFFPFFPLVDKIQDLACASQGLPSELPASTPSPNTYLLKKGVAQDGLELSMYFRPFLKLKITLHAPLKNS